MYKSVWYTLDKQSVTDGGLALATPGAWYKRWRGLESKRVQALFCSAPFPDCPLALLRWRRPLVLVEPPTTAPLTFLWAPSAWGMLRWDWLFFVSRVCIHTGGG